MVRASHPQADSIHHKKLAYDHSYVPTRSSSLSLQQHSLRQFACQRVVREDYVWKVSFFYILQPYLSFFLVPCKIYCCCLDNQFFYILQPYLSFFLVPCKIYCCCFDNQLPELDSESISLQHFTAYKSGWYF